MVMLGTTEQFGMTTAGGEKRYRKVAWVPGHEGLHMLAAEPWQKDKDGWIQQCHGEGEDVDFRDS